MAWLRLYDSILDDPKIQMLSDRAFRMLINLWCLAKRRGGVIPDDIGVLMFAFRWPEGRIRDTLQALISARLVERVEDGYAPHDWAQHQYDSDSAAERMQRYRARNKQRNALRNSDVLEPDSEPEAEVPLAKANGRKPAAIDPWKQVYDRGKEVFGNSAGGIITNLRKTLADKPRKVLAKIEDAAEKRTPIEWINAFLWEYGPPGIEVGSVSPLP